MSKINQDLTVFPVPMYRDIFSYTLPIIFLYIYVFQPPIIDKNIYIAFQSLIVLLFAVYNLNLFLFFLNKFKVELGILFLIIMYSSIRDAITGEIVYTDRFLAWGLQSFIFGFFVLWFLHKIQSKRVAEYNVITLLYWTSFVAAVLTALLIFNSTFDNLYSSVQLDSYYERYESFEFRYRAYGIAENLTFTYSYILGFFAGYTLLVIHRNWILSAPLFLFILGIFFNARIGFLGLIIFLPIFLTKSNILNISQTLFTIIVSYLALVFLFPEQFELISTNSDWVLDFFYNISNTFFGTHYTTSSNIFETLFGDFLIFPQDYTGWLFGTGESLFTKVAGRNSDIGYIIQLYYGGLVLIFLLAILVSYIFFRLKNKLGLKHWFTIVFILSVLILNFKGFIFAATPGGRMLFFLYVYFVLQDKLKPNQAFIKNIRMINDK